MKLLLTLFVLLQVSLPGYAQTANTPELGRFVNRVMDGLRTAGTAECIDETVRSSTVEDVNGEQIEVSAISEEYANELFREIARDPAIPFNYPDDGCYARAHYMSRFLEDRGVISDKVFIEGQLRVNTPNHPQGFVEWRYHVAPVVKVRRGNQDVLMVFDPSIFPRPVPVEEWVAIQTTQAGTRLDKVYNTRRFVYAPEMDGADTRITEWQETDVADMNRVMLDYLPLSQARRAAALARTQAAQRRQP